MKFGDYLKKLRESRNKTKTELAKAIEVSLTYYMQIENSEKKPPTFEKCAKIVEALNLTRPEEVALIELAMKERTSEENNKFLNEVIDFQEKKSLFEDMNEDENFTEPTDSNTDMKSIVNPYIPAQAIPIISWVHASSFISSTDSDYPVGYGIEGKITTELKGNNLFALKIKDNCMEPEFRDGDIVIINPRLSVNNGDFVVAKLNNEEEATFKQLKYYDTKIILHPLNPSYNDMEFTKKEFDQKVRIVGRVVEKKKRY